MTVLHLVEVAQLARAEFPHGGRIVEENGDADDAGGLRLLREGGEQRGQVKGDAVDERAQVDGEVVAGRRGRGLHQGGDVRGRGVIHEVHAAVGFAHVDTVVHAFGRGRVDEDESVHFRRGVGDHAGGEAGAQGDFGAGANERCGKRRVSQGSGMGPGR